MSIVSTYLMIGYFGLGLLSLYLVASYAKKHGVESTVTQAASAPSLLIFALALWPAFVVNDLLAEIPKQRMEREKQADSDEGGQSIAAEDF